MEYFSSCVNYVKGSHGVVTQYKNLKKGWSYHAYKCKKNSGLRTFHSSATRLWNGIELSLRDTFSQKHFFRDLQKKMMQENSVAKHFDIDYTY